MRTGPRLVSLPLLLLPLLLLSALYGGCKGAGGDDDQMYDKFDDMNNVFGLVGESSSVYFLGQSHAILKLHPPSSTRLPLPPVLLLPCPPPPSSSSSSSPLLLSCSHLSALKVNAGRTTSVEECEEAALKVFEERRERGK